ncbi:MAG: ATP-binding protein [Treponema sp.]|nr:ATP-binding protein [Treponema sp.]
MEIMMPWFIGLCIFSLCMFFLAVILFIRNYRAGKAFEELAEKRTFELKLQTSMLTTLFDSIPDIIFIKDMNFRYIQCNKAFLDFFGRKKEDVIGKDDKGLGLPDNLAEEFKEWDLKVINEGRTATIEEYSLSVHGTIPLMETIKAPLILDDAVIGVLGIARDITRHKEMEHKITSSYEYAKILSDALAKITKSTAVSTGNLETVSDIIAQEGCIALKVFSVGIWRFLEEENALECISCYDAYTGENPIKEKLDLSIRKEYKRLLNTERLIVMNNSEECRIIYNENDVYYDSVCSALDAPIHIDGKLVGVVCVEQMRCNKYPEMRIWEMEEQNFASSLADLMALAISGYERRKALNTAETASQTKSFFLANMSHEIRTPMNAILGVTEILIQYESLPAEIEEGLGKIYSSCDLLLGIINDILDFSKIEAGKLDIMPAMYKVANMINDSVQLNMMRIDSKPIEFELQVDENIPAKLIGDELRIKQILNNLLSNAFKYTDSGKVTLSIESVPHLDEVLLILKVRDTGHGMSEEQLEKMFDKYSRFNHKKNITVEGTGLGLAITQRLVHLMNGSINAESELGKGTLFEINLPQQLVDQEALGAETADNLRQFRTNYITRRKRGQIARDPMPYGSVLIVDDVETNLYVAVGLMKLYRLKIDTAMSGQEAIDKIKEGNNYDVIFMDHMMPEMDGIEAVKKIRKWEAEQNNSTSFAESETRSNNLNSHERIQIVALTANAIAGQADVFLQNGFDDFISKPIDIRQLNNILNRLIRDKQPLEVIEAARRQKAEVTDSGQKYPFVDSMLLESFIRDAKKTITWIEEQDSQFNNEDDIRKFTIIVHGIKSSLYNIGETMLSEMAYNLEKSGREQNAGQIEEAIPDFLNDLRALLERLEQKQDEFNDDEDIEDLQDKLLEIQEMCSEYNRKDVLELITEIKNTSKETREVINIITEHVHHSEFEEAENAAAAYAVALSFAKKQTEIRLLEKEINGLNIIKGLQRYGCDEQTYLKVLRSYAASVRSMLDVVENVSIDTLNDYKIKVHGIKGTSLDIFAVQIGTAASDLEKAAKSGDFEYITANNNNFLVNVRKMVYDIEVMLAELDAKNPKPKKDKPDQEELKKLLIACKDYDMDGADAAILEIEKYQYESDDGLADWLKETIDKMDFKQIVEKLGGLI